MFRNTKMQLYERGGVRVRVRDDAEKWQKIRREYGGRGRVSEFYMSEN